MEAFRLGSGQLAPASTMGIRQQTCSSWTKLPALSERKLAAVVVPKHGFRELYLLTSFCESDPEVYVSGGWADDVKSLRDLKKLFIRDPSRQHVWLALN